MKKLICLFFLMYTSGCGSAEPAPLGDDIDGFQKFIGVEIAELKEVLRGSTIKFSPISDHDPEESVSAFLVSSKGKKFFIIGDDKVDALLFRDENFKSRKGVKVGQSFCQIIELYSGEKFKFKFSEVAVLQLHIEGEKVILDFNTSSLPLGEYISQGHPSKDDSTLCSSRLSSITLSN